jgi:hypothetical protein
LFKPKINTPSTAKFWDEKPHLFLNSFYRYEEDNTLLSQTVVVNENSINCYNIWEHCFTEYTLVDELKNAGFSQIELFGDIAGKEFNQDGNIICALITK